MDSPTGSVSVDSMLTVQDDGVAVVYASLAVSLSQNCTCCSRVYEAFIIVLRSSIARE